MNSSYYDQTTLWNGLPSAAQIDVAQALKLMIPPDVRTVLDAGCGSGIVTNVLVDEWDVLGCDISQTALAQVKAPTVLADLTDLPFADGQFDLVLSSDVIEHIPDASYRAALDEISRVAGKYILIAVPYREILEASAVQCPKCRHRFHAHYHQRSYLAADFENLFPRDFEITSMSLAGERWPFNNKFLAQTGLHLADLDYDFPSAICPACETHRGSRASSVQAAIFEKQLAALQYLRCEHGHEMAPTPSELLVLLKRISIHGTRKNGRRWQGWHTLKTVIGSKKPAQKIQEPYFPEAFASKDPIVLEDCPRLEHLINYPRHPYVVPDGDLFDVLLLPTLPSQLVAETRQTLSTMPQLDIYDAVRERYLPIPSEKLDNGTWLLTLPTVCPGTVGYRIRIPNAAELKRLEGIWPEPLGMSECFNLAFTYSAAARELQTTLDTEQTEHAKRLDAQQTEHAKQLDAINQLANEIEARRAAVEKQLSELRP